MPQHDDDVIRWSRKPLPDTGHYYTTTCSECGVAWEGRKDQFIPPKIRPRFVPLREWSFEGGRAVCPACITGAPDAVE